VESFIAGTSDVMACGFDGHAISVDSCRTSSNKDAKRLNTRESKCHSIYEFKAGDL
jgi:hypothetical protein